LTAKESLNPLNCLVFLVCKICSPSHSSTLYMRVGLVAAICCALRLGRVEGESEYGSMGGNRIWLTKRGAVDQLGNQRVMLR